MAKKRKGSVRSPLAGSTGGFEARGGNIGRINTFEDVADSEDEFHINQDKMLLDEGPDAKRRRKWQEEAALLGPSDDEVLGYSSESEKDSETDAQITRRNQLPVDISDGEELEEENEDLGGWGSSKKDYYDNDQAQTEADALEEEAEAKRLQLKKLQKMTRADFGLEDFDWGETQAKDGDEEHGGVVREKLEDIQITPAMGAKERMEILQNRYPEFEYLADDFIQLSPILDDLKLQVDAEELTAKRSLVSPKSIILIRYRALGAYLASLGMYFAILTSPARDQGQPIAIHPEDLHSHAIMETLRVCREVWSKARDYKIHVQVDIEEQGSSENPADVLTDGGSDDAPDIRSSKKNRKELARLAVAKEVAAKRVKQIEDTELDLADLSNLIPKPGKPVKRTKKIVIRDSDSDFGEEESMDAREAAEKARKKKTLQFYTSQIAQKVNKRAGAGRDAGGDEDLPHRERLRDRQARLNIEAEARGKKLDEYGRGGATLGGESDSEEDNLAAEVRGDEDEYYDLVAKTSKKKKNDKEMKLEALNKAKAEGGLVRVVEGEVDEDGKRAIGYVIEKNKGLAPKRKKDVRNPRVKKRKKYEEKKKKLASTKAVYKGGEERGGYGGEKTGIKSGLVKSIKL